MAAQTSTARLTPSERTPDAGSGPRIPSLDGLRAISIALVLLGHLAGTAGFPVSHEAVGALGPVAGLGVRVFFVISGYLITTLLLDELQSTGTVSLRNFYLRRLLRIFPANYAFVTALWLASMAGLVVLNRYDVVHAFTYTMNYYAGRSWYVGHLWSLSVEEQFYMIWPALLRKISRQAGTMVCLGVLLLSPVVRLAMIVLFPSQNELLGHSFQTVADTLAAGCLLALLWTWLAGRKRYQAFLRGPLFWLVPAALMGILSLSRSWKFDNLIGQTLLNIGIVVVIERFVRYYADAPGRFLNWQPVKMVGVLSYSLYLWQQPFLHRDNPGPLTSFPVNLLVVGALALASYYCVEKPFLELRKKFQPKRRAAAASASH